MENQLQANRKFAQIPNKMFYGTGNHEKLTYVLLQSIRLIFPVDIETRMTITSISQLSKGLSSKSGYHYLDSSVELFLERLKKEGYINFDLNKGKLMFEILPIDTEEEHTFHVNWKSNDIILTGVTKIDFKIFFKLFKDKDFTLYAYTKYRMGESYEYRITYDEWAFILWGKREDAMAYIKETKVIVKFTNSYDSHYGGRRPNTYVTFDSIEDENED